MCKLSTLVVLSVIAGATEAAEILVRSEVRVASGNNFNPFTTLYWHRNESAGPWYSTLTDHGSFYNVAPGEGDNVSHWSGRAAAQAGTGFMRVYSEIEALLGSSDAQGRFVSGHQMAVNGNLAGLVESDGTERVTPSFLTGARAEFTDTITPIARDPETEGEAGSMQIRINVNGNASYSQSFYQRQFAGRVNSETAVQIQVGSERILQRFQLARDFYWDWESKPFADDELMGSTVTLDVPIIFGETYDLDVAMWSWAQIAGDPYSIPGDGYSLPVGMHTVIGDYHNTATWEGVSLFDEGGRPVEGSAMVDGEDYTGPFTAPPPPELPPLAPIPIVLLGDVNLDEVVNGLDVDPFVDRLLNGPYQAEADMNEDQVVNGLDVDPFVAAVVGGGTHQIPEPSTFVLTTVALLGLLTHARRRRSA